MKATLFSRVPYMGPAPGGVWPVPTASFSPEAAEQSMEDGLEQFQLADELGFDWITLAEHHYAPLSLTPNPMVRGSAATAGPASYTGSNRAVSEAVASAGYYGRDAATQRGRLQARAIEERIELGQLLVGSPDTVLTQIRAIRAQLDAGILDLNFLAVSREKILRALELFGTKVLPRIREL